MLPPEQHRPCYPPRVLALEEEGFGFAVLEAEDLAIAANVELSLNSFISISKPFTESRDAPTRAVDGVMAHSSSSHWPRAKLAKRKKRTFPG